MLIKPQHRWDLGILAALFLATLTWDAGGQDMAWAHWYGTAKGFALKNDTLLQWWFHDAAQNTARALFFVCIAMVWLPLGVFKHIPKSDRVHLIIATLLASLLVVLAKQLSKTSCPWTLAEFGGAAQYVSHWRFGISDGGGGRCFPGGHSSAGFAFIAASFWLRSASPGWALGVWCWASLAGLALGWVQQMRGAHFLSHTLWAWVICSGVGVGYYYAVQAWRARRLNRI